MSKLAFVVIVYNGSFVLRECLQSILPFGQVYCCEGPVSFFADRGTSNDGTNEILAEMLPKENIIHGIWREKTEMMNALNSMIPDDVTHLMMVDSDEVHYANTLRAIVARLDAVDSIALKPYTFFGSFDHTLSGFEEQFTWYRVQRWYKGARWEHRPPTVFAPDGRPWREYRHWDSDLRFAHYSYCLASAVKAKIEYYSSRNKIIPDYFRKVWLAWTLGNDATRKAIEDKYQGVHEWLPSARGECRTRPFKGEHPIAIQEAMPRLKARFERELDAYRLHVEPKVK